MSYGITNFCFSSENTFFTIPKLLGSYIFWKYWCTIYIYIYIFRVIKMFLLMSNINLKNGLQKYIGSSINDSL